LAAQFTALTWCGDRCRATVERWFRYVSWLPLGD